MKRMKVLLVICLVAVMALSLSLTACAKPAEEPETKPAVEEKKEEVVVEEEAAAIPGDLNGDGVVKIGYDNLTESENFFQIVVDSLEVAFEARGWKMIYAVANRDAQEMRNNTESFVLQGADFIIDFNVVEEVGSAIATDLKEKGIPMMSIDSVYENAYFFGVNNTMAGETIGNYLIDEVEDEFGGEIDYIVHLYIEATGPEVKKRNAGAGDVLKAAFPDFNPENEIWINVDNADPTDCKTKMADFLTAHPDSDNIVAIVMNDDRAISALSGIEATGRMGDVIMGSHNSDPSCVNHFKTTEEDAWKASVNYNSPLYGENISLVLDRIFAGEDVEVMNYNTLSVTTRENVFETFPD